MNTSMNIMTNVINMMITTKNNGFGFPIVIQIPRIKVPVPLFIVFRAIGVESDKEICEYILLSLKDSDNLKMSNALQASIIDSNTYITQEECIRYITSQVMYTPLNVDRETGAQRMDSEAKTKDRS